MSSKVQLTARFDQRLAMNQSLTQAINLLQYATVDLKQMMLQSLNANPLLELDESQQEENSDTFSDNQEDDNNNYDYYELNNYVSKNNYTDNPDSVIENYSATKDLRGHLLEQTLHCHFDALQQRIAEAIVDAIDDDGYLMMTTPEIVRATAIDIPNANEYVDNIIKTMQTFDPPGVACHNIRECLLIQLELLELHDATYEVAHTIIDRFYDDFIQNKLKNIPSTLNISASLYKEAIELIKSLNPKPGNALSINTDREIEPELFVKKVKDSWHVYLRDSILTKIKVNSLYHDIIAKNKKTAGYANINKELQEAQLLIKALHRRNETLKNVATYIIQAQINFLEHGPTKMKPMNISDAAQTLNLHESTISRITSGKFIATPRGMFELKYFFPTSISTATGLGCSDTAVKEHIKDIIRLETTDKVFSDDDIANLLKEKGINIARRTIAKYRIAMKILPSYQRARQF